MTYRYAADAAGTDEDDAREPFAAICDYCDQPIHPDEWKDAEEGITHYRGTSYMEHCCSDCRTIGNRERWEYERAHARGKL